MTTQERILTLVSEQLGIQIEKLALDTTFQSLNIDSLDLVEIIMETEEEFDVDIPDDAAEQFATLGDVVNYVENASK